MRNISLSLTALALVLASSLAPAFAETERQNREERSDLAYATQAAVQTQATFVADVETERQNRAERSDLAYAPQAAGQAYASVDQAKSDRG